MTACAVLLRGINVGGHAKVPMAELREVVERAGCSDVVTYVQSGNVACRSDLKPAALSTAVSEAVRARWGLDIAVVVRSHHELQEVVAANPFGEPAKGSGLHVYFLAGEPDRKGLAGLERSADAPDDFSVGERELYLWAPDGIGRSKLAAALTERRIGTAATARNWNTVRKMLELTGS